MNPMRRFPYTILTSLSHPATSTTTALLRPLSTKPTTTANDEWNDAWESAWLPDDLSGQNRAPWESDVNFSLPHTPPAAAATDVDAETKAFVEDMTDNWEQRRKSPKTQQRQEKEEKLKEMEKSSLYCLESIKRDYRVQKQRIHAGLWVKEIEKQEEDKLGDGFGGGGGIESLLDSCSEIFDSPNNDLNNTKIPSSSEFKNKPDGWETTAKAQDGSVWEMSQREEDILIQEFERRIAFSKFQLECRLQVLSRLIFLAGGGLLMAGNI
ncbi:protein GAMETE CELL DEFECTIVE 1, mitochondrial isoform X2 [Rhododendron vialii]|uniref:protein GAMETE CELL DEFECTIVE 1, mitochondrial isoform X2 n=1 Tax=Rhododendron vialii TaxID=182163 RepID=UPI00265E0354|nr:protein GAMETE CELL DEFECTIVE 1, mitochondrial isoform X2 [Rhododendron vialii]